MVINYELYYIKKKVVFLFEIFFYKRILDKNEKEIINYDYKKYKEYLEHNKLFQKNKKIILKKIVKKNNTKLFENIIQKYNFQIDIEKEVKFIRQNLFQNSLFCLCMETILKNLSKNEASKFQKRIYQYEKKYIHKLV